MGNPSKDEPWAKIFDDYGIHDHDFSSRPFPLSAAQIKMACQNFTKTAQKEVRFLCYQANRSDRPQVFVEHDLFLLPVKNGFYYIVQGEGYIDIPEITSPIIPFQAHTEFDFQTPLVGNSEMQHLDYAHVIGLTEHFVGEGKLYLTIRGRKYTPEFSFLVGSHLVESKSVQTEVDAGYEGKNIVVLIEGKNIKMDNIITRQLYYPYRKWSLDTSKKVIPLFFEKRGDEYMFWRYEFTNPEDYTSAKLVHSARYKIQ